MALDESVAHRAATRAEEQGVSVSAWLNAAAERALVVAQGLDAVREWEADHGSLSPGELAWADSILDGSGRVVT